MLFATFKATFLAAALASVAQSRVQEGVCGINGLDGITGDVPACMFEAGTTVSSLQMQLRIIDKLYLTTLVLSIMDRALPTS